MFTLHENQQKIVECDKRFRVAVCGRRFGKALALDTPIMTTEGFKRLVDVKVGDFVFNELGSPTEVLYKSEIYEGRDCYEVQFSDGSVIVADASHDWVVEDKSYRKNLPRSGKVKMVKKTTEEMASSVKYLNGETNYSIPLSLPLQHEEKELPIEPYFVGLWLGDGSSRTSGITTDDQEVMDYLKSYANRLGFRYKKAGSGNTGTYYIVGGRENSMQGRLRKLNLLINKHIPEIYLTSSIEQRLELLMGLMDSDGYAGRRSNEYTTIKRVLAEDVQKLLSSLSIKSTIKEYDSKLNGKILGKKYRIHFNTEISVFTLPRKKINQGIPKYLWVKRRYITGVKKVNSVPVQCLSVDSPSHLFLAGYNLIATHNTILSIWEMFGYAAFNRDSKVVYIAPSIKQARDICWSELKKITKPSWSKPPNETRLEVYIKTHKGGESEIWLRGTENIESLRGLRIDFLVVDEVASIVEWSNVWREVLRPTLVDRKGCALFTGTPKGLNHFYQMYLMEKEDDNWKSFKFTSYDNPFIPKDEIDAALYEAQYTNTLDEFRQEYMAEFVTVSGQVYKEWDPLKQFVELSYEPSLPLYVSMDFGVNDPTAIIWMQRNGGEYRVIDYYEASDANISHFLQVIRSKPYKEPELYCGDPAGRARNVVTGTSIIDEYARSGIFIRTVDGVRIPDQIRITHKYMKSMFVSDKLGQFRDCILNYRYPNKENNTTNELPLHDKWSHGMRALEYMFVNLDGFVPSSFSMQKPVFVPKDTVIGV